MGVEYVEPHLGVKKLDDFVERYVEVTAKRPCKVLGFCGFITIFLVVTTATIQPAPLGNADWYITDEKSVERKVCVRARASVCETIRAPARGARARAERARARSDRAERTRPRRT